MFIFFFLVEISGGFYQYSFSRWNWLKCNALDADKTLPDREDLFTNALLKFRFVVNTKICCCLNQRPPFLELFFWCFFIVFRFQFFDSTNVIAFFNTAIANFVPIVQHLLQISHLQLLEIDGQQINLFFYTQKSGRKWKLVWKSAYRERANKKKKNYWNLQ